MNSTFKTSLAGESQIGFFKNTKQNSLKLNQIQENNLENKQITKSIPANQVKRNIENRFLNTFCLNDKNEQIGNFNTKGINLTNFNTHHLNIDVDKLNIKKIQEFLTSKEEMDVNSDIILKHLYSIDEKIEKMKNFISKIKRNEMFRITNEFNQNDYERRYKTTKFKVLSALLGEENAKVETIRQSREQKNHSDKYRIHKRYNYNENNSGNDNNIKNYNNSKSTLFLQHLKSTSQDFKAINFTTTNFIGKHFNSIFSSNNSNVLYKNSSTQNIMMISNKNLKFK